jgi:hypothetical protein
VRTNKVSGPSFRFKFLHKLPIVVALLLFSGLAHASINVSSVTLNGRLVGGSNLTASGTVTITRGTDPNDNISVSCTVSSNGSLGFPNGSEASFVIPSGQTTANFTARAGYIISSPQTVPVTARCIDFLTIQKTIEPFAITLTATSSLTSGSTDTGTVTASLDAPAEHIVER